jgi:hypothetical protein
MISNLKDGQEVNCDTLRRLPSVFHLADLTLRLGLRPRSIPRVLYIWNRKGYVCSLGGQSRVYVNLAVSNYPDWEMALRMVMPSAVISGLEALRRAGWITQIPYLITVTVSTAQKVYQVDRFQVTLRAPKWFDAIARGVRSGEGVALPSLAPAWALADLVQREGWCDCGVGPDDIYWDQVSLRDQSDWVEACSALGMSAVPMNPG